MTAGELYDRANVESEVHCTKGILTWTKSILLYINDLPQGIRSIVT